MLNTHESPKISFRYTNLAFLVSVYDWYNPSRHNIVDTNRFPMRRVFSALTHRSKGKQVEGVYFTHD